MSPPLINSTNFNKCNWKHSRGLESITCSLYSVYSIVHDCCLHSVSCKLSDQKKKKDRRRGKTSLHEFDPKKTKSTSTYIRLHFPYNLYSARQIALQNLPPNGPTNVHLTNLLRFCQILRFFFCFFSLPKRLAFFLFYFKVMYLNYV